LTAQKHLPTKKNYF